MYHVNTNKKKVEVAILILNRIDTKKRKLSRNAFCNEKGFKYPKTCYYL